MPEIKETKLEEDSSIPPFIERNEIVTKAKQAKQARELPEPPGKKISFEALQGWLKLLTPEMTEDGRIMLYVYRLFPVINRKLVDSLASTNIDVIGGGIENLHSLTEEYFIERHGGGKYKICVSDGDNPNNKYGKTYIESFITIPDTQYPPKLDLREVVWEHPNNKSYRRWAIVQRLIGEDNMPIVETKEETKGNSDLVPTMKLVMDFVKQLNGEQQDRLKKELSQGDSVGKGIQELLLERMKQDDPNKQMSTVATLISAIKTLQPDKPADNGIASIIPMFVQMMQQQADTANKQFMMMMEMVKANKPESNEGRDSISQLKDLVEVARELKGSNPSAKSATAEIIEAVSPILGPAFQIVANLTALKMGQKSNAPANDTTPSVSQQPTQPTTITRQDMMKQQLEQPSNDESVSIIKQFGPIILNRLQGEGWEFAAWVVEGFGDGTAMAAAKYGTDALMEAAKKVPEFWNQVVSTYGEEYLKEWLNSFCNYKEIMKRMEEEEMEEQENDKAN